MFDSRFPYICLGRNTSLDDPKSIKEEWIYRFDTGEKHVYYVYIQRLHVDAVAIKFCDKKDEKRENRYSLIYNDRQVFKVIATVLNILVDYLKKHPTMSFGYFATPRTTEAHAMRNSKQLKKRLQTDKDFKGVRSRNYQYIMVNMFPPHVYVPVFNTENNICIMVNRRAHKTDKAIASFTKKVTEYMAKHFNELFDADEIG